MSVWETNKQRANRQKALDKLKEQLLSPLPKPKRLKKLRVVKCPWQVGDILAIEMPTGFSEGTDMPRFMELIHNRIDLLGKYVLIELIGTKPVKLSKYAPDSAASDEAYFCIYHWWGDDLSGARDAIESQQVSYKRVTVFSNGKFVKECHSVFSLDIFLQAKSECEKYNVVGHVTAEPFIDLGDKACFAGDTTHFHLPYDVQRWLANGKGVKLNRRAKLDWFDDKFNGAHE